MNTQTNTNQKENVLFGIIGALLFSLAGGVVYFLLDLIGMIASLSGVVGVWCAIVGYKLFAKKESVKGIIISAVLALLVIVLAWYLCFAIDIHAAYSDWYEAGEVDFQLTFAEALEGVFYYLGNDPETSVPYIIDLFLSVIFAIAGGFSYVRLGILRAKSIKEQESNPFNPQNPSEVPVYTESPVIEDTPKETGDAPKEPEQTGDVNESGYFDAGEKKE